MIDKTKTFEPWPELPQAMRDLIEQACDHYGLELTDWQRTLVACMVTDPPQTTYVLHPGRRNGLNAHKTAAKIAGKAKLLAQAEDEAEQHKTKGPRASLAWVDEAFGDAF